MRKKRNCATGGSLDPYTTLASYGTEIAGDYASAYNYKPQLGKEKSEKEYAQENIMAGIMKGPIGAAPSIIRMMKDKNTIVSGSPGSYKNGGPVDPFYPFHAPLSNDSIALGKAKGDEWKRKTAPKDAKKSGWLNDDAKIPEEAKLISEFKKQPMDNNNPETGNFGTHNWSKEMGGGDIYGNMTLTMPWAASGVALKDKMD
jgi:hypothetical protein